MKRYCTCHSISEVCGSTSINLGMCAITLNNCFLRYTRDYHYRHNILNPFYKKKLYPPTNLFLFILILVDETKNIYK